jgi:hypothetical protein
MASNKPPQQAMTPTLGVAVSTAVAPLQKTMTCANRSENKRKTDNVHNIGKGRGTALRNQGTDKFHNSSHKKHDTNTKERVCLKQWQQSNDAASDAGEAIAILQADLDVRSIQGDGRCGVKSFRFVRSPVSYRIAQINNILRGKG